MAITKYNVKQHRERGERVRQSVDLYKQGSSISKIADKIKVAQSTVVGYLLEQGIDLNKKQVVKKVIIKKKLPKMSQDRALIFLIILICLLLMIIGF
jgi:hypothetical protein